MNIPSISITNTPVAPAASSRTQSLSPSQTLEPLVDQLDLNDPSEISTLAQPLAQGPEQLTRGLAPAQSPARDAVDGAGDVQPPLDASAESEYASASFNELWDNCMILCAIYKRKETLLFQEFDAFIAKQFEDFETSLQGEAQRPPQPRASSDPGRAFLKRKGEEYTTELTPLLPSKKTREFLSDKAVTYLKFWLVDHYSSPYPSDEQKVAIAAETGLTRTQIDNWFVNARTRIWVPSNMFVDTGAASSDVLTPPSIRGKRDLEQRILAQWAPDPS